MVENAKVVLGVGAALFGIFEIPFPRLDVILRNAVAPIVAEAKPVLDHSVALLGVRAKFGYGIVVRCFLCGMERGEGSLEKNE